MMEPLTVYTDPELHSAQRYRDGRTDGQTADAKSRQSSRSCVSLQLARCLTPRAYDSRSFPLALPPDEQRL